MDFSQIVSDPYLETIAHIASKLIQKERFSRPFQCTLNCTQEFYVEVLKLLRLIPFETLAKLG